MTRNWAFRHGPALARCSVVGCNTVMPGPSMQGFDDGAVVFVQDMAPGWVAGSAMTRTGESHNVLLCPVHATVASALNLAPVIN